MKLEKYNPLKFVNEDITIPLNRGDSFKFGKFKNKTAVYDSHYFNDKGDLIIVTSSGKEIPASKIRLMSEREKNKFTEGLKLIDLIKHRGLSKFTEPFMKERRRMKKSVKLIDCVYNKKLDYVEFQFLSEPTFDTGDEKEVSPKSSFKLKPTRTYEQDIRVVGINGWISEFKGDEVSRKDMVYILKNLEIKLFCFCPSFHWAGGNWVASQYDASIYPTNIPQKDIVYDDNGKVLKFGWKTYQKEENVVCKHLDLILVNIDFWLNPMSSSFTKKLKDRKII